MWKKTGDDKRATIKLSLSINDDDNDDVFEVGRIVKNKQGKKAYLINEDYYSVTTSKHQYYVRNAIPTWAMVFSVGDNISDTGNMRFVASKLESIKKSIEKYKRAKTELSYTDIWGAFGNMMDYIQFFNMGTAKSILKKSANDWLGTNHELSKKTVEGCVGNAPGRRVSARSGGGHHRSPVESKSVRKRFANRWVS